MTREYDTTTSKGCVKLLAELSSRLEGERFNSICQEFFPESEGNGLRTKYENEVIAPLQELYSRMSKAHKAQKRLLLPEEQKQYQHALLVTARDHEDNPIKKLKDVLDQESYQRMVFALSDVLFALNERDSKLPHSDRLSDDDLVSFGEQEKLSEKDLQNIRELEIRNAGTNYQRETAHERFGDVIKTLEFIRDQLQSEELKLLDMGDDLCKKLGDMRTKLSKAAKGK